MSPPSTLEYGYATGRQDPPTRVVPADEPDPRSTATPQQEGLQAEKVIKGLFTGNFNFDVKITAAANKTALTVTASSSSATIPAAKITLTFSGSVSQTILQLVGTPAVALNDSFLKCLVDTTLKLRISGQGSVLAGDGSAGSPSYTFLNETGTGLLHQAGVANRVFLVVGALTIAEFEQVAASPGDGVRRHRLYGTGNAATEPHLAWATNTTVGVGFWDVTFGDSRVGLYASGQRIFEAVTNTAQTNASWTLLRTAGTMVRAASGTHPRLSLLELHAMPIGTGTAPVTDVTTLFLEGAPLIAVTGGKARALWVRTSTAGGLAEFEGLVRIASTFTAVAGASATLIDCTGTLTEAVSGNHARLSLVEFAVLAVTAGAATVTDATTVYIAGAPAAVVTGKNRALWVVAGESEFGGVVTLNAAAVLAGSPGSAGAALRYVSGAGTTTNWFHNVPTGGAHLFAVNDVTSFLLAAGTVQWHSGGAARWQINLSGVGGLQVTPTATALDTRTFWTDSASTLRMTFDHATGDLTLNTGTLVLGTDPGGTELFRVGGAISAAGEVHTFGVAGATGARLRLRYFYAASPANPPQDMADLMIVDNGVTPVFRVRYNDAGVMKAGDLALA